MPKPPWYSPARLLRSAYVKRLRPFLPAAGAVRLAGVAGPHDRKLGDLGLGQLLAPGIALDQPRYEEALATGLRRHVRPGDSVVVVGGGYGITTAIAALCTGPDGRVICYEGNGSGLDDIRRTLDRNGVGDRVDLRGAIVGAGHHVYGDKSTTSVRPEELPECDVLELDCEGAERGIIGKMTIRPRAIIVETHGSLGAPTAEMAALLGEIGYAVIDLGWAEPELLDICVRDDIRVLAATHPR